MKKNYTSPAIQMENIEVEQGIAMSITPDFTVGGFDEQEDLSDMWQ